MNENFVEVISLIEQARNNAIKAVNTELINLYWNIGGYISSKIKSANWGEKTVDELAQFIQKNHPELKGFNRSGLFRMRQFYETYIVSKFVAPVRRQIQVTDSQDSIIVASAMTQFQYQDISNTILTKLSWTHHRTIFSRCKRDEEREFYLRLSIKENYTVRELDRQINASVFERTMLSTTATKIEELVPKIGQHFKDQYVFEFLNLPDTHSENDLQKSLIHQMKSFLLELGKDFLFMGQEYRLQIGNSDFYIDLLFYHRSLQCLVAFELKADKFKPEHLGQLNFYLEALDRDIKNANENPSIGILLCKDKDDEVVEYALSRQLSPTLVSQYELALPDKKLLQAKLHEVFEQWNDKMNQEI